MGTNEQIVIMRRYGFIDGNVQTLEEIGQFLGLTRERVRQIEQRVLRKLRTTFLIQKYPGDY
jgi:RNA polymerase primary sigma factor